MTVGSLPAVLVLPDGGDMTGLTSPITETVPKHDTSTHTRLVGPRLNVLRAVFVILTLLSIVTSIQGLPHMLADLRDPCPFTGQFACDPGKLTVEEIALLPQLSISMEAHAWFYA